MRKFKGFPDGKVGTVTLPAQLFSEIVMIVDDLDELKTTLYAYRVLLQKEGDFRYLLREDFANSETLMAALAQTDPVADPTALLDRALSRAVERGTLLAATVHVFNEKRTLYFANTERGRSAVAAVRADHWQMGIDHAHPVEILPDRPNIFQLYEDNIGQLTPLLLDELKDAEQEYPAAWLEEAVKIAVEKNVRHWRFVRAVLERWKKEGRHRETDQRNSDSYGEKYISDEFADFIEY